jgi:hypothetical protein
MQNYQMKLEIQALRERINYLEQINQQEEWSRTYIRQYAMNLDWIAAIGKIPMLI